MIGKLKFCNNLDRLNIETISSFVAKQLSGVAIRDFDVKKCYEQMQWTYNTKKSSKRLVSLQGKASVYFCRGRGSRFSKFVKSYSNIGTDLPVWLSAGEKQRKTIMLVGQDSYREGMDAETFSLCSPWGIHDAVFENVKIKGLVQNLIDSNFDCVYITDFNKLFFSGVTIGSRHHSYTCYPERVAAAELEIGDRMLDVFRDELNLVKPQEVVFLGKSHAKLMNVQNDVDAITPFLVPDFLRGIKVKVLKHPRVASEQYYSRVVKDL